MTASLTRRRSLGLALASIASFVVASLPSPAQAAEVEITATLSETEVDVGQGVLLEVEISVANGQNVGLPRFAGAVGLTIQSRGVSSGMSMQFGGGSRSSQKTKTYSYVVVASAPGEYDIDLEVEVDGKMYLPTSKPKLVVGGEAAPDQAIAPAAGAVPT